MKASNIRMTLIPLRLPFESLACTHALPSLSITNSLVQDSIIPSFVAVAQCMSIFVQGTHVLLVVFKKCVSEHTSHTVGSAGFGVLHSSEPESVPGSGPGSGPGHKSSSSSSPSPSS